MAGSTNYPTSLDSHTGASPFGFQVMSNNLATTVTATAGAADATLTVTSTTGFESRGVLVCESEIITYTGKTSTTFTGCSRGVGGTTAAAHVAGTVIGVVFTAAHHDDLAAAIVALETRVGTGTNDDHVMAYRSSGTLTPANTTETAITLDAEQYDSAGLHSTSANTSRLTAVKAGLYEIEGQITWDANTTGLRESYIRLNGSTRIAVWSILGIDTPYVPVRRKYRLAAADYVELTGWQSSGAGLNVVNGALYTWFGMTWLTP